MFSSQQKSKMGLLVGSRPMKKSNNVMLLFQSRLTDSRQLASLLSLHSSLGLFHCFFDGISGVGTSFKRRKFYQEKKLL